MSVAAATAQPANSAIGAAALTPISRDLFRDIEVELEARLGTATLTIDDMLKRKSGSTIRLETGLADFVDVYLNGALIARGEIVAVDDRFGVKLLEIADRE